MHYSETVRVVRSESDESTSSFNCHVRHKLDPGGMYNSAKCCAHTPV